MINPIGDPANPCDKENGCQVKSIYENMRTFAKELTILDRAMLLAFRLRSAMDRRIERGRRFMGARSSREQDRSRALPRNEGTEKYRFKAGDLVEVRPLEEIKATLKDGKTGGLGFMTGMEQYCGAKTRVLKRVKYIFDEREWGMLKCDSVLLENLICNGRDMYTKDGCDRSCFFFWKDAWLRKL